MSDTSPDPKPLTDEAQAAIEAIKALDHLLADARDERDVYSAAIGRRDATITTLRASLGEAREALTAFDPADDFIDNGVMPWDLEPHFFEAMLQLTRRKAYSKAACAQLIAEKAKEAADAKVSLGEAENRADFINTTNGRLQTMLEGETKLKDKLSASEGLVAVLREACIEKYDVMYCGENGRTEFHRCRLCGNRQDDVPSNMPVNHAQDCPLALSTTPATRDAT